MNVWLLYKDSEFGLNNGSLYKNEIVQDLNLDVIFKAMAKNDKYMYKTVKAVMLHGLVDAKTVLYRQNIMEDCNNNYEIFCELYLKASQTIEETERFLESTKKANVTNISNSVSVLNSLNLLGILVNHMDELKEYLNEVENKFTSTGMKCFCDRFFMEYNVDFGEKIKNSIEGMNFLTEGGQITFSASVGHGLKFNDIIVNSLSKDEYKRKSPSLDFCKKIFFKLFKRNVIVLDNSEVAHNARELESAGLVHILKMYQNFIKELMAFFENLHYQMAYYVGCANLHTRFSQLHIPVCIPKVLEPASNRFEFRGLYDMSMAILNRKRPITNELTVEDKSLFIITGANQGGKSTYLRSIGIAQVMMQCGMFVPADYYSNKLCDGIFTHFTRREDNTMNSGKLDEELGRMNQIINHIKRDSMLLLNESFATTTEREGSMIAYDLVNALHEEGVIIFTVTHLFEFTKMMYEKKLEKAIYLSAERLSDGTRTYHIFENEPERTSYGLDLYEEIIEAQPKDNLMLA